MNEFFLLFSKTRPYFSKIVLKNIAFFIKFFVLECYGSIFAGD